MKSVSDFYAGLNAGTEILEPLWNLKIDLLPVEIELINSKYLRRLHFIRHSGSTYLNTHIVHSRLQHTLGVFSLAAYFYPNDFHLRVAALLHDIGHTPLSHSIEQIEGVNHHKWTNETISDSIISEILKNHKLNCDHILAIINGDVDSILNNKDNYLHIDHLDSWVRSGFLTGSLKIFPKDILSKLSVKGKYVRTDMDIAKLLFELIINEARLHCSVFSIGTSAIVKSLALRLINENIISVEFFKDSIDSELEYILLNSESTKVEARKLWFEFDKVAITKEPLGEGRFSKSYSYTMNKLYLSIPMVNDKPFSYFCNDFQKDIDEVKSMMGTYYVYLLK